MPGRKQFLKDVVIKLSICEEYATSALKNAEYFKTNRLCQLDRGWILPHDAHKDIIQAAISDAIDEYLRRTNNAR